ncbi:uncharacterized protein C8orf76 homolog [Macrobrachium nipponense]|uniref:uncharacterized protein C8orf76 homolog n=1 Tax=Macrobrachium nipponense TaxID=159736 RepID=UPI0030C82097
MEFAGLDDDLFSEERQRPNPDENYSARYCESCWFLEASSELLVSDEDELSVQKHSADYLFFKKDFGSALARYESILSSLPASNTTVRRECYEGIVRSCMKLRIFDKAFEYAEKLHSTSKTVEQTTVSCSVLIDAGIAAGEYSAALETARLLVLIHPFNADAWLKLARCYASFYDVSLPSMKEHFATDSAKTSFGLKSQETKRTDADSSTSTNESSCSTLNSKCKENEVSDTDCSKCKKYEMFLFLDSESEMAKPQCSLDSIKVKVEDNTTCDNVTDFWKEVLHNQKEFTEKEKGAQFVCGCLYRSFTMLKRTEGTSSGFALDSSLAWQKKLWRDMRAVLDEQSLNFVVYVVQTSDNIYSSHSPLKECSSEFVDRGSSKFKSEESEINVLESSLNSFEKQWFKWIK